MSAEFDREFTAEVSWPPLEVTGSPDGFRHFVPGPMVAITVKTKADSEQHNALIEALTRWNERRGPVDSADQNDGGFLVPEEFAPGLLRLMRITAWIRRWLWWLPWSARVVIVKRWFNWR